VHSVAEFGVEGVEEAGSEEGGGRGVDAGFTLEERCQEGGEERQEGGIKAHSYLTSRESYSHDTKVGLGGEEFGLNIWCC